MGWFEDACDWVEGAVADVGEAFDAAGDAIEEVVSEVVDWATEAAQDVGQAIGQTFVGVGETIVDFGEAVVDTFSNRDLGDTWSEFGMNALDNMVFDPVDYLTGGDVNVDYEDGTFTADIDLDLGIGAVGLHVGDAGFDASASFDVGIAAGSVSFDSSAGFAASGSIGIADGPFPYVEGHLSITPEGGIIIGGELQATLPLPGGGVSIGLDGQAELNPDGSFGAQGSFDTSIDGPMGTSGYFHADGFVEGDALDGQFGFGSNVAAGGTGPGGAHVDADAGFTASIDRDRVEAIVDAGIDAGAGGASLNAGVDASVAASADGVRLGVDRWADLDLPPTDGDAAGDGASDGSGFGVNRQGLGDGVADGGDAGGAQYTNTFSSVQDLDPVGFAAPAEVPVDIPVMEAPPVEAPQDDFSQQIEATEDLGDAADDMWDGLTP